MGVPEHSTQPTSSQALFSSSAFLGPKASAACPADKEPTTAPTRTADVMTAP